MKEKKAAVNLVLYCPKKKPYLYYNWNTDTYCTTNSLKDLKGLYGGSRVINGYDRVCAYQDSGIMTNGHILAECDFKGSLIEGYGKGDYYIDSMSWDELEAKSLLEGKEFDKVLKGKNGCAIEIKKIHILKEPRTLSDYCFEKAPTHLTRFTLEDTEFIIIPLNAEEMCKVLNEKQKKEKFTSNRRYK